MSTATVDVAARDYRAFVVEFANQLTAEEIYQVSFIWLKDISDITVYEPTYEKKACGLQLFSALECRGIFNWKELDGLLKIAKAVNRFDLAQKVESFTKKKGKSCAKRYTKKRKELDAEKKKMEVAYEALVTHSMKQEQCIRDLQKALRTTQDFDIYHCLDVLQESETLAQDLASEFCRTRHDLSGRSRTSSSASSSSEGSTSVSSRRNSQEVKAALPPLPEIPTRPRVDNTLTQTSSPSTIPPRSAPIPKPRRRQTKHPLPVYEEQSMCTSQTLTEANTELVYGRHSAHMMALSSHGAIVPLRPRNRVETMVMEEERDWTGDSGMGTGSGSAECGTVEEWKSVMKIPPPPVPEKPRRYRTHQKDAPNEDGEEEEENHYATLTETTKDKVHSYKTLERGRPF